MPLPRAGKRRLVRDVRVDLVGGVPERAQRALAACVVPDAGRDDPAWAGHARHLAKPLNRVGHEVHHELSECRVERVVGKRQVLCRGAHDVDAGMTLTCRLDERLRRIDGRDARRVQPADELGRERAGAATDVEHPLALSDLREACERACEPARVPTHEAVVRVSGNGEGHRRNLRVGEGLVGRLVVPVVRVLAHENHRRSSGLHPDGATSCCC